MIIEYAGIADRFTGPGVVHMVRAWWDATSEFQGDVRRDAKKAVRSNGATGGRVEFMHADVCTHNHPRLNALMYFRVLEAIESQVPVRVPVFESKGE